MFIFYLLLISVESDHFKMKYSVWFLNEMPFGVPMFFSVPSLLVAVQLLPIRSKCTAQ